MLKTEKHELFAMCFDLIVKNTRFFKSIFFCSLSELSHSWSGKMENTAASTLTMF